jgi:hypothetical protein
MNEDAGHIRASNRVIVKLYRERYGPDTDLELAAEQMAAEIPGAEVARVSRSGRVLLNLSPDIDPVSLAADLNGRDSVEYAEPDVIDRAQGDEA